MDAGEGGSVMVDHEVQKIVDKLQKLRALRHARERVRQLERELSGEPAKREEPPRLPEFLRQDTPLQVS
jgi:predicted component of type VI protein secretion system